MTVASSVLDAIGNTPLIRLRRASELTGCDIYGKAESLNMAMAATICLYTSATAQQPLAPY